MIKKANYFLEDFKAKNDAINTNLKTEESYIKTLIKNADRVEIRQGAIKVSQSPLENKS